MSKITDVASSFCAPVPHPAAHPLASPSCPKCSSASTRNGKVRGQQRHRCICCHYNFVLVHTRRWSSAQKLLSLVLICNGASRNSVASKVGATPRTLSRWLTEARENSPWFENVIASDLIFGRDFKRQSADVILASLSSRLNQFIYFQKIKAFDYERSPLNVFIKYLVFHWRYFHFETLGFDFLSQPPQFEFQSSDEIKTWDAHPDNASDLLHKICDPQFSNEQEIALEVAIGILGCATVCSEHLQNLLDNTVISAIRMSSDLMFRLMKLSKGHYTLRTYLWT